MKDRIRQALPALIGLVLFLAALEVLRLELRAVSWPELTRDVLDDFAYQSHVRAARAIQAGEDNAQILPLELPDGTKFTADQGVRMQPDRAKMSALKPVFRENGVVTAGNSSQISDGAAALVLASPSAVGKFNLTPLARIEARVVVGSDPTLMLDGPIPATKKVLEKAGLSLEDIDLIEINEAFASVVLAWAKELGADMDKVNPSGGRSPAGIRSARRERS